MVDSEDAGAELERAEFDCDNNEARSAIPGFGRSTVVDARICDRGHRRRLASDRRRRRLPRTAQVHRSHWVASGQAKRLVREKDRRMIELVDGRRLPVSRPYLEEARKLVGVKADSGNATDRLE
jgi:hypothetical protein